MSTPATTDFRAFDDEIIELKQHREPERTIEFRPDRTAVDTATGERLQWFSL